MIEKYTAEDAFQEILQVCEELSTVYKTFFEGFQVVVVVVQIAKDFQD